MVFQFNEIRIVQLAVFKGVKLATVILVIPMISCITIKKYIFDKIEKQVLYTHVVKVNTLKLT